MNFDLLLMCEFVGTLLPKDGMGVVVGSWSLLVDN